MSETKNYENAGVEVMMEAVFDQAFLTQAMTELKLTDEEVKNFGVNTSHTYRAVLVAKAKKNSISDKVLIQVVMMAAMCKNKDRILKALKGKEGFDDHVRFIQSFSQYNGEGVDIAFVNVPACMPGIAMLGAVFQYKEYALTLDEKTESLPDYCKNTFFGQLDLDSKTQKLHKDWETTFWNDTVTKTRRKDKDRYEKGFHEDYYQKKEMDKYPLPALGNFNKSGMYSVHDVIIWAKIAAGIMTGKVHALKSEKKSEKKGEEKKVVT
jgi:hypothetical protein